MQSNRAIVSHVRAQGKAVAEMLQLHGVYFVNVTNISDDASMWVSGVEAEGEASKMKTLRGDANNGVKHATATSRGRNRHKPVLNMCEVLTTLSNINGSSVEKSARLLSPAQVLPQANHATIRKNFASGRCGQQKAPAKK